ncbi:hypothetical protein BJ508DRAFT_333847 [Ascobolus immersus RN42]|uniref:Uncharacterized protein n=1 Tax=Ascobolus immersus RN42 TaxID=1160509 RepID=A0A3N4HIE1_ASCIM|nr:hypothetical protein BJ508DRAFT_333847 [Ascobolus immersus RN42]
MPPRRKTARQNARQAARQQIQTRITRLKTKQQDFLTRFAMFRARIDSTTEEVKRVDPEGLRLLAPTFRLPTPPVFAIITESNLDQSEKAIMQLEDWLLSVRGELRVLEKLCEAKEESSREKTDEALAMADMIGFREELDQMAREGTKEMDEARKRCGTNNV